MLYLFLQVTLEWKICTGFAHCIGCVERALFVLVLQIVIKEMLYTRHVPISILTVYLNVLE